MEETFRNTLDYIVLWTTTGIHAGHDDTARGTAAQEEHPPNGSGSPVNSLAAVEMNVLKLKAQLPKTLSIKWVII